MYSRTRVSPTGDEPFAASTCTKSDTSRRSLYIYSLLVWISLSLIACGDDTTGPDPDPAVDPRGTINELTKIGTFSPTDIRAMIDADSDFDLPPEFPLTVSVDAYRVAYSTVVKLPDRDTPIETVTSGALFAPTNDAPKSVLTLLHGTESKRDRVASVHPANSNEGLVGISVASGGGHVVSLPDYPGYGISDLDHSYFNIDANVPSIVDMMLATNAFCKDNEIRRNGRLYLTGYSEGGFFAYHTQRMIQESYSDMLDLTAVAPMAGPYDLAGTVQSILTSSEYVDLAYVGFVFTAYDRAYGWQRLQDIFHEPYAALMPSLYDGSLTWAEILGRLPSTFTDLVRSEFVAAYLAGEEAKIADAFAENTVLEWGAIAPVCFFHGDADRIVPIDNAYAASERLIAHGSSRVDLIVIEGGTHMTAGGPAVLGMLGWFGSM